MFSEIYFFSSFLILSLPHFPVHFTGFTRDTPKTYEHSTIQLRTVSDQALNKTHTWFPTGFRKQQGGKLIACPALDRTCWFMHQIMRRVLKHYILESGFGRISKEQGNLSSCIKYYFIGFAYLLRRREIKETGYRDKGEEKEGCESRRMWWEKEQLTG